MYFKPSYLPQNGAANILVRSLAEDLGLSLNKKYEIILASFLAIAKKVNGQAFDWWAGNENKNLKLWSLFPHISNKSVRKVYRLLKENDYVVSSTDFPNHFAAGMGFKKPNWVKAQRLPKHFLEVANFVEKKLEASGIILREMNSYGIKNCLRLTIGNNYENNLLLNNLKNNFKNV